jgi:hypothetical protein
LNDIGLCPLATEIYKELRSFTEQTSHYLDGVEETDKFLTENPTWNGPQRMHILPYELLRDFLEYLKKK